ncbi:unnamed protein product [Trichobilharzia szidati]|nr:unnamed protein product [Trichobilharzia szidati]
MILLSNRSVGPIMPLPDCLSNRLLKQIKDSALEEIEDIKSEIAMLSDKLPGFDSPRLQRRLSRYLESRNSIRSQSEEFVVKQPYMPSINESVASNRIPLKVSNITPVQLTQVEDAIRHKSEIIRTLNPDILDKWYRQESNSHPDMSYLQPVSLILPGITLFDDQNRRQAELKSWLSDAHRIRCLLLKFSNRKEVTSSSSFRSSEFGLSAPNTERIETKSEAEKIHPHEPMETTSISDRKASGTSESLPVDNELNFQSEVERKTEVVLQNSELNSDCFVHIRCHQESHLQATGNDASSTGWRSRSLSMASWSTTKTNPISSSANSTASLKNDFLLSGINESLVRAKYLVNWARLRVPANNQSYYELEKSSPVTMDDQINCSQSYLDPITFQEHAIYLDDMCRNIRNKFSQSLIEEMDRRHQIEIDNVKMNKRKDLPHWCTEFEMSAHFEAMDNLSLECIAREDKITQLLEIISKHTKDCQETDILHMNYFKFIHVTGDSGSGKSVLLASLAKRLITKPIEISSKNFIYPRVIYRMIGSSTMSLNLLNLLNYLCLELSTQMTASTIPDTYDGLRIALRTAITEATYEQSMKQPLIIILDGIENLEECKQRKDNFPISWIPFTWLKYKPVLNCPVIFLLSTTNGPVEVASFHRILQNKINQHISNNNDNHTDTTTTTANDDYVLIHLRELDIHSMEQCVKAWLHIQSVETIVVSKLKSINKTFQPLQLKILVKLLESRNQHMDSLLKRSESLTSEQLFTCLLSYAELYYGLRRVQFILGQLIISRWGLNDEDLITLFWSWLPYSSQLVKSSKLLHSSQNPSNIMTKPHRMSIQGNNNNNNNSGLGFWSNDKSERVYVTRNWLYRFLNEFLKHLGILTLTRSPPYGCYQMINLRQQSFRYWLESYYLNNNNNNNKIISDFHILQTNTFYLQHRQISPSIDSRLSNESRQSLQYCVHWRWIHEVPYHLSKLGRLQQLKQTCFCNSLWLNLKAQLNFFTEYTAPCVQNLLDDIILCMSCIHDYNNDQQIAESESEIQSTSDVYIQQSLKRIHDNPDIWLIMSILIQWKHKLTRDPFLLKTILMNNNLEDCLQYQLMKTDDDGNTDQNTLNSNQAEKEIMMQKSLTSLIESIHQPNTNTVIPSLINFKLRAYLCSNEQLIGSLTSRSLSMPASVGLSYVRNKIQINAIAYSTSNDILAISTKNLESSISKLELWNVIENYRILSIVLPCSSVQTVNELAWIATDEAILGIETPSQRVLVWPMQVNGNFTISGDYYSLMEDYTPADVSLPSVKENCSISVVETGEQGIAYIVILQQGVCKLSVWLWKERCLTQIFGPVSLVDIPSQSGFQAEKLEHKAIRSMSLPSPVKSNTELFLTTNIIIESRLLQIICAARGDSHATMFSINLNSDHHFNLIQPLKQKCLKCPNQGTRLLGISSGLGKPIVLASRSPSNILPDEDVIGCIDLFDQVTGNYIKRIESSCENVFTPLEPYSKVFGLLSYSSPPKLDIYINPTFGQIITVVQNSSRRERRIKPSNSYHHHHHLHNDRHFKGEKDNLSSGLEVVLWDINKSTSNLLEPEYLMPYLTHEQYTFIAPLAVSFRDINHLSMVKPILEDYGHCLINCNPLEALTNKLAKHTSIKGQTKDTWEVISSLCRLENTSTDCIGFIKYSSSDAQISLGIIYVTNDGMSDSVTKKYFPVKPFEKDQWHGNDVFIFNGRVLITLEKLEYSPVVEECKEVYQRMGIYELIQTSSLNEFTLQHRRHLSDVFIIPSEVSEYTILEPIDQDGTSYLIGLNETRSHFVAYSLTNGQIIWRLKPDFTVYQEYNNSRAGSSCVVNELSNSKEAATFLNNTTVEKFLFSGNKSIMVASYGLECACVFLLSKLQHVGNLDEAYAMQTQTTSCENMLEHLSDAPNLTVSAISYDGCWLVHSEFSPVEQSTCLTVWSLINFHDCNPIQPGGKDEGSVQWNRKRLSNQSNLIQVGISGVNCVVVGARLDYGIILWCPCKVSNPLRLMHSERLEFSQDFPPILQVSHDGTKVISASGSIRRAQVSIWQVDLDNFTDCLIGHVCCLDDIIELEFTQEKQLIAMITTNSNEPRLVNPHWITYS